VVVSAQLTEAETSKFADLASGKRIHYNEAGSGAPMLFMHGTGPGATSWSNFNPNFQVLAQRFRCILVDALGWGESDPISLTDEARNTVNARSMRDLMDALGIERASIVGNSMGGGSGLAFAIDYPERLDKLVVMGSGAGGGVFTPTPTEGIRIINETYRNPTVENFGRLVRIMVYDASFVTDALLEQRRQGALRSQTHLDNWVASQRVPPRDIYPDLPKIRAKTLMIHGRNDRTVPLETGLLAFARIPGAQFHIFNECAHWAQLEKVDQFNRLVEDFLTHDS